ncbi:heavy metal translocating P-type ATPase metal-binding domain-containing protein [Methylomarinum vadi]|uniref:heavy metal translocating P-type ATPase metal-binding domain-containing protein n=1 Tax=Methylomarinum vadi TaxID=438855 RepID=UPI0004DF2402|nr:heavy metal translocating P-type ATPase metal-binding domain-containing protein [Methylomarinum vadi]
MSDEKKVCDLCGLPIETPGFELKTTEGGKKFCCEGCKGIYQMLHEGDIIEEPETSSTEN